MSFKLGDVVCLKRNSSVKWRIEFVFPNGEYTLRKLTGKVGVNNLVRSTAAACRLEGPDLEWLTKERPTESDEQGKLVLVHLPRG